MFDPTSRRIAQAARNQVESGGRGFDPEDHVETVALAKMLDYVEELEWSVGKASA
jgi:hypothetical protein